MLATTKADLATTHADLATTRIDLDEALGVITLLEIDVGELELDLASLGTTVGVLEDDLSDLSSSDVKELLEYMSVDSGGAARGDTAPRVVDAAVAPGACRMRSRSSPTNLPLTGECWCGCSSPVGPESYFASGHDRYAESAVIKMVYGGVAAFLEAHDFGPSGRNLRQEYDVWQEGQG